MDYLRCYKLLPPFLSGFRPGHSFEPPILRVVCDILAAIDRGDFAALAVLDLSISTAFDTRLQQSAGETVPFIRHLWHGPWTVPVLTQSVHFPYGWCSWTPIGWYSYRGPVSLTTVGPRVFPVAGDVTWNSQLPDVTSAPPSIISLPPKKCLLHIFLYCCPFIHCLSLCFSVGVN